MNDAPLASRPLSNATRTTDATTFHRRMPATLDSAARCVDAMHAWLARQSPGSHDAFHAALIVDELVHNVAMHGQPAASGAGRVVYFALWVEHGPHGMRIALHDNGPRFDALAARPPRARPPSLDDPVGGLGMVLLQTLLHAAQYQYCAGENRLRLIVPPVGYKWLR